MYDYINGLNRIKELIHTGLETSDSLILPKKEIFKYNEARYVPTIAIFVDIRESTKLFSEPGQKRKTLGKIIKSFTSEVIEILLKDQNGESDKDVYEIGIRGDCVYAMLVCEINSSSIDNVFVKAELIVSFEKMLNKVLDDSNFPNIKCGIGIADGESLVIKAGREGSGINDFVWVGKAVPFASKFSNIANKDNVSHIVMTDNIYLKETDTLAKRNTDRTASEIKNWFKKGYDRVCGIYYHASVIKTEFDRWIDEELD